MTVPLKVLVLAGGPDRERPVSLQSGAAVAEALKQAGCEVEQSDIIPDDLSALEAFTDWDGDVIFPLLHGPWGEGGPLQAIMDDRNLCYVGTRAEAARLCMDKQATKDALVDHDIPTPEWQVLQGDDELAMAPPVVIKPLCEGSSIDVVICPDDHAVAEALKDLRARHDKLLIERMIHGKELTVGIVGDQALPVIEIVPATKFYDYDAKYQRDDTQYRFDIDGLNSNQLSSFQALALRTHRELGCRHLSRVDLMVDDAGDPWVLEINTLPGFTDHSLVPKAAAHAGLDLSELAMRLVRLAKEDC